VEGGHHEDAARVEQPHHLRLRQDAGEEDAAGQAQPLHGGGDGRPLLAVAHDDQAVVGEVLEDDAGRLQQIGVAFLPFERPDGDQPRLPGQAPVGEDRQVHPGGGDPDPFARHEGRQLPADLRGHDDHPVGEPDEPAQ